MLEGISVLMQNEDDINIVWASNTPWWFSMMLAIAGRFSPALRSSIKPAQLFFPTLSKKQEKNPKIIYIWVFRTISNVPLIFVYRIQV